MTKVQVTFPVSAPFEQGVVPEPILVVCSVSETVLQKLVVVRRFQGDWNVNTVIGWPYGHLTAERADAAGAVVADHVYNHLMTTYGLSERLGITPA